MFKLFLNHKGNISQCYLVEKLFKWGRYLGGKCQSKKKKDKGKLYLSSSRFSSFFLDQTNPLVSTRHHVGMFFYWSLNLCLHK
jgi:hypothetical protein